MNNNWIEFRFGDLILDIYKGKVLNKDELTPTTDKSVGIRYITRTGENNGCELIALRQDIPDEYIEKGNAISIGDTTATCFYQAEDFIVGDHMVVIRADWLKPLIALYAVAILNKEQYKYSYGRAFLMDRIKDTIIKLPADEDGNPDWQFMEDYIKSLHYKPLTTKNKSGQSPALNVQDWQEFKIENLFSFIEKGKCSDAFSLVDGNDINYIGAKYKDNGVMKTCSKIENAALINSGNCIAMIGQGEGSAGYAIYLDVDFIGATSLNIGYADWINPYTAHFVTTILCLEYDKYSFGRSWTGDRLKNTVIKLPAKLNKDGTYVPNWQFMEDYIKSLPYSDCL